MRGALLHRRAVLATVAGGAATAAMPFAALAANGGRFLEYRDLAAPGLPNQRVTIWLPPGYHESTRRYRVLYMHDAQNLFDPALSNFNKVWAADKAMIAHAAKRDEDPWIIVGLWSPGADRYRQYMPLPAYTAASPNLRARMDAFGNGKPIASRSYIDWIADILKPWVDRSLRTKSARADTAMIGSSMGGLISLYAFLEHAAVFGRAGCLSTHWPGTDPTGVEGVDVEMLRIWTDLIETRLGPAGGRKIWFDHGDATLDAYYPPYQDVIDATIGSTPDWVKGEHWESRSYSGAEHEENAWAQRLPDVFDWVLG